MHGSWSWMLKAWAYLCRVTSPAVWQAGRNRSLMGRRHLCYSRNHLERPVVYGHPRTWNPSAWRIGSDSPLCFNEGWWLEGQRSPYANKNCWCRRVIAGCPVGCMLWVSSKAKGLPTQKQMMPSRVCRLSRRLRAAGVFHERKVRPLWGLNTSRDNYVYVYVCIYIYIMNIYIYIYTHNSLSLSL